MNTFKKLLVVAGVATAIGAWGHRDDQPSTISPAVMAGAKVSIQEYNEMAQRQSLLVATRIDAVECMTKAQAHVMQAEDMLYGSEIRSAWSSLFDFCSQYK